MVWPAVLWSDQTNRRFRQPQSRRMRSSGGHEGVEHGDIQQHAEPCRATPASGTRAGFACVQVMTTAGFSGATTDRPAPRRLLADITAGRASAITSAASPPTSSPAVRYWNRARQRYHRLSARYSRARVSLPTQAVRPGPDNRGKPRLLDLETRIPARDRFAPDSPLEGTVSSELVSEMPISLVTGKNTGNPAPIPT